MCLQCYFYIIFLSNAVHGIIKNPRVAAAMKAIDRGFYSKHNPYQDSPQSIGFSVTISAPHMVCLSKSHAFDFVLMMILLMIDDD